MLVVVNAAGAVPQVHVVAADSSTTAAPTATTTAAEKPPNPILPVGKEIAYALGGFLLLFVLMRYWIFPTFRRTLEHRQALIRSNLDSAEAVRTGAEQQAAAYESGIAQARAEANRILEGVRAEIDADRQAKLGAANTRIGELRSAAAAEMEAARQAAQQQVEEAVADVAAAVAGRALGHSVDPGEIRDTVREVVTTGVAR